MLESMLEMKVSVWLFIGGWTANIQMYNTHTCSWSLRIVERFGCALQHTALRMLSLF